jgi:chloride channel protein, CIC family
MLALDHLPSLSEFAYAALAIALIAGVLFLSLFFFHRFRSRVFPPERDDTGRPNIVKSFAFGKRRRLVVIRRGDAEHVVMIGGPNDVVIETILDDNKRHESCESDWDWLQEAAPDKAHAGGKRSYLERAKRIIGAGGLMPLALLSCASGAGAGAICGLFRLALEKADRFRDAIPLHWQDEPVLGCGLLIAGAAAAAALSAFLVRQYKIHAAGSGIPQVEAAIRGDLPPAPFILLPLKFVGGLLAIGAGLALGREGPCVQMGATISHFIGRAFRRSIGDCRALLAAGAGAGLAAAFDAPLAGSAFVLEELLRRFETRNAVAALGASGSAIVITRLVTGSAPDFAVSAISDPALGDNLLCFLLGGVAGLIGVIYNRVLFGALALADGFSRWPTEARAAFIGAAAGALAWFAPGLAGGGDDLTQRTLDGTYALVLIPFIFALRLILGAASYAAGTPGGLFAPLLALGAQIGFLFGGLVDLGQAGPATHAAAFAVVGMAALFTAVVRAPLTGMILVTEMTANSILLLPMLAACFSAMAVATMLGEPPVYDVLRERTVALWRKKAD